MKFKYKLLSALTLSACTFCLTAQSQADVSIPLLEAITENQNQELPSLAPLLNKVVPAVVNISISGKKQVANNFLDLPEQFRFFFPDMPRAQERPFQALGSGVIIDAQKGYVITNYHVIDGATEIKVTLNDGRVLQAKKIGEDQQTDFALLQLENFKDLTDLKFADSDKLRVGDFAIAIGNPFGLGQTVTSGIISALGRSGLNIENYENFIQTDAAINSGNSGGALINLKGELIGINTAIIGKAGGNIGIGFAIPSNMAKSIVTQLISSGKVSRGMLGIIGTAVSEDIANNFNYKSINGAFVNEVKKNSAADKAGIKSGDILNSINGVTIQNFGQLRAKIATLGAGTKVKLGVFRDGKQLELDVVLDNDENASTSVTSQTPILEGVKLTPRDDGKGIEIKDIDKKSKAARLNLAVGDIIVEVNKVKVKTISELEKAINKKKGFIALKIIRGNSTIYITTNY